MPDVTKEPRYVVGNPAVRSELAVPLFDEGNVVGVIDLDSDVPDNFPRTIANCCRHSPASRRSRSGTPASRRARQARGRAEDDRRWEEDMSRSIKKAVLPVAGLGMRFLPATKAIPKEMLADRRQAPRTDRGGGGRRGGPEGCHLHHRARQGRDRGSLRHHLRAQRTRSRTAARPSSSRSSRRSTR